MNQAGFNTISALRIYMKRGDDRKATNWWGRMFEKPLSHYLVRTALQAGISHASVTLGHVGFATDAMHVSYDDAEISLTTLPVCLELVAPKRILEQFIREQARHLVGTTLVMVDGVHISSLHLAEVDAAVEHHPHSVEYITDGDVPLTVAHVEADDENESAAIG
jgi:PII-like signaling protein